MTLLNDGTLRATNTVGFRLRDVKLTAPPRSSQLALYFEKSQDTTLEHLSLEGWDGGIQFFGTAGIVNQDWFNNLVVLNQISAGGSLTRPNLDWQGIGLHASACDFSGLPPQGIRAAVRIRANSYDARFETTYYEHGAGLAGGDVFLCEGGQSVIDGGFTIGGQDGTKRVANYINARSGAVVHVRGIVGFGYWGRLVSSDGPGTIVYVAPACFSGSMDATTRFVETNGGRVIIQ